MAELPNEIHNRVTAECLTKIVKETGSESAAMVVMESLLCAMLLYYRPIPRHRIELLDSMTQRVVERVG